MMSIKIKTLPFFTAVGLFIACDSPSIKKETSSVPDSIHSPEKIKVKLVYAMVRDHPVLDTFIIGNFDKDRIKDTAFSYGPMDSLHWGDFNCWPCKTTISFSNGTASFESEQDFGSHLENMGDLDKDGIDEVGRYTSWFTGGWTRVMILKNINGTWKDVASTSMVFPFKPFKIKSILKNLGNGKILLYGDHPIFSEPTEKVYDLKADTLPCLVSEKKFEDD